jgi:hypothetical protein
MTVGPAVLGLMPLLLVPVVLLAAVDGFAAEAFDAAVPFGSSSVMMFTTATAPLGSGAAVALAELLLLAERLPPAAAAAAGAPALLGLLPQGPWEATLTS